MVIDIDQTTRTRMREWRHALHGIPELAYREFKTADFVADTLLGMGLRVERGLAGTGVIGVLEGTGTGDRSIGFRAELDALPIQEPPGPAHASRHDGMMHACGHDGHMAMVLGAADHLSRRRDFAGRAVFVFQPAEENEGGARRMIEDGLFDHFPVDAIYAVHNWPGLEQGRIAVQPGPMMAHFDTFDFRIRGQGGHAGLPHLLRDPITAAGQLIAQVQNILSRNIDPFEQGVISITFVRGGEVHNVLPDEVHLGGTVRSFTDAVQDRIEARLGAVAAGVAAAMEVDVTLAYERRMPTTSNSVRETALAQRAAHRVVGSAAVDTSFRPSMGAEDFSVMLHEAPGAYAWIGAGPARPGRGLHQSGFDFNDAILDVGAAYYAAILAEELHPA